MTSLLSVKDVGYEIGETEIPYKKIIFEKNVYTSICDFFTNYKRIHIITSPTPKNLYLSFLTNIMNEKKINYWVSVLNKNCICNNDTILKTCAKIKNADLLVSFGAGTITDITKITALNLNLPYCVIPTTITHFGLLNNIAYITDNQQPRAVTTDFPIKVFIDEGIIKKSPERFIFSSINFSIALIENQFILETKKILLNECSINILALNKKLRKIEELLNWVYLSKDFALLNLMDYIIDLSEICKNSYESNAILFSLLINSSTLKHNFGEKCLLASTVLLNLYLSFFNQSIVYVKSVPCGEKIARCNKNASFFEEFIKKTKCYLTNEINMNINSKKHELVRLLNYYKTYLSKYAKKVLLLSSKSEGARMIDEYELYFALGRLPYIHNDFLLNVMTRYGNLNVIV